MRFNYVLDSEIVPKVAEWLATGRGVLVWSNQEIGGGGPREVLTPQLTDGRETPKPGWRYGNPEQIDINSLRVETFTILETFRGRIKAYYWGTGLAPASEAKAKRLAAAYGDTGDYRYVFEYPALARIDVGVVSSVPYSKYKAV